MAPPAQPYINIQTGHTAGTIVVGSSFSWYNSGGISCTVTNVGAWCSDSSYGPISAGASESATATTIGNFSYVSACLEVNSPIIIVHPVHPVHPK
jgi:hypothetical protein